MTRWLIWSALLAITSGAGTLSSRARNSPSLRYHAAGAMLSHGTFFVSSLVGVDLMVEIIQTHSWMLGVKGFLVYAMASTAGSVSMHWLAMRVFEKRGLR